MTKILTPDVIIFSSIFIGCAVGKMKISCFSLGGAAHLVSAVCVGAVLSYMNTNDSSYTAELTAVMSRYSSLGTSLFVSSVGLSSAVNIGKISRRKFVHSVTSGIVTVIGGFIAAAVVLTLDGQITAPQSVGLLCGALTSTPGMAAAREIDISAVSDITLGYGCSYIFGVVSIVLVVIWLSRREKKTKPNEREFPSDIRTHNGKNGLAAVAFTVVTGSLIGQIKFPWNFSLGATGGLLLAGISLGLILKKTRRIGEDLLDTVAHCRGLGLVLFLAANGISAGLTVYTIMPRWFLYGAVISLSAISAGYIFTKVILRKDRITTALTLAGGMTSTPAVTELINAGYEGDLSTFSVAYTSALLTTVFGVKVMWWILA